MLVDTILSTFYIKIKMNISELKQNLQQIIYLRDEIVESKKETRFGYSLKEYLEQFRYKLIIVAHGERDKFWCPRHVATQKLDSLSDLSLDEFNSAYSKNKTKLLSIINRYIKEMKFGFIQHDLEINRNTLDKY